MKKSTPLNRSSKKHPAQTSLSSISSVTMLRESRNTSRMYGSLKQQKMKLIGTLGEFAYYLHTHKARVTDLIYSSADTILSGLVCGGTLKHICRQTKDLGR